MSEFELIKNFFKRKITRTDVICGIGDDAAIVSIPHDKKLALTTDTLVENVHFPKETPAYDIGFKAAAVNLSDLAAMGATPAWVLLALTLPHTNLSWIESFCQGFFKLIDEYQVALIGGDLTAGPLSITVQACGLVSENQICYRSGAKPGDYIYVTGTLGDAAVGLSLIKNQFQASGEMKKNFLRCLNRPTPRIKEAALISQFATAMIDISDGFAADLSHILTESRIGACVRLDDLPLSSSLKALIPKEKAIQYALCGGDDYELCFTIPHNLYLEWEKEKKALNCLCTCVGVITETEGLTLINQQGEAYCGNIQGYEHF